MVLVGGPRLVNFFYRSVDESGQCVDQLQPHVYALRDDSRKLGGSMRRINERAQATAKMRREISSTCNKLAADGIPFVLRYTVAGIKVTSIKSLPKRG